MQVFRGARSFIYSMRPVRIFHELKSLIVFNEFIQEHFRIVKMHVIITTSMYVQQISFDTGDMAWETL